MKRHVLAGLLLLGLTTMAMGQVAGKNQDLFLGGSNLAAGQAWMIQIDRTGQAVTLNTGAGGWPLWGNIFGMAMDWDNLTVVTPGIAGTASPLQIGLFNYDPIAQAVIKTIAIGPSSSLTMSNWANLAVNCDGNPVTIDNATTPQGMIEFDRGNQRWIRTPVPGISAAGGISGCEWDKLKGGLLHACWGNNVSTLTPTMTPTALYRTDWKGVTTTVAAASAAFLSRYGGTQVENGDWISSTCCTAQYYIVKAGGTTWSAGPTGNSTIAYEVSHEKWAAPGSGVWLYNYSPSLQVKYLDLGSGAITTVYISTLGSTYEVLPLWLRDVGSARLDGSTWAISINPDRGNFAGKTFILACSLAPCVPGGIKLPDGRQIFIGIDELAKLTVAGPVPPFLTGSHGTLNASGRAMAMLNLKALGKAANGTVLHFCAVVLDQKAPNGIGWVCEPHPIVINNK